MKPKLNPFYENILDEAHAAAKAAIAAEIEREPENPMAFDCGFSWVTIDGKNDLARYASKTLKNNPNGSYVERVRYGDKGYPKGWQFWEPGNFRGQSVRIHLVGSRAFAKVLNEYGYTANVSSRLD